MVISPIYSVVCASTANCQPDSVFEFARYLEETGDYYRAVTEYKRFIFHWPEHPTADESRYRTGMCYLKGNDNDEAISIFQELLAQAGKETDQERIRYALARALFNSGNWFPADYQLQILEQSNRPISQVQTAYSRLWCRLKPGKIADASTFWRQVMKTQSIGILPHANAIETELNRILNRSQKRPKLAGFLSAVVPGLGQTYGGRWRDGVVSFLVNGLFIGAIAAAIDHGHEETAVILGFFEIGFYSANIYNAVNDAHKYNRIQLETDLQNFTHLFGAPFSHDD